MQLTPAHHILETYKLRLLELKQNPCADMQAIRWYEEAIDWLEAEVAVDELIETVFKREAPVILEMETDCWQVVDELCRQEKVIFMRIKWSWKLFRRVWFVQYIKKHGRECYSSHQNIDGSY